MAFVSCMDYMRILLILIIIPYSFFSCTNFTRPISAKNLHEKYGNKLKEAGLSETALGKLWFSEAEKALRQPAQITLPYREVGYFPADMPKAAGLVFSAKRGQKVIFSLEKNPIDLILIVDLWKTNTDTTLLFAADTVIKSFEYEVEDDNEKFVLRLQPELLKSGDYILSIAIGPSLGNPVAGNKGKIGSIWGDARDAGIRRHEGIDIFAPFRTPVIAAADGIATKVNENRLGGKVVWFRPEGKNYTLYYAHLDEQLVGEGVRVNKGDTLGFIGNTGNARTTPPHLHFGIYTFGGAINPLPFVDPIVKKAKDFPASISKLKQLFRLTKPAVIETNNLSITLEANTLVEPLAFSLNTYRVQAFDGTILNIPEANLRPLIKPIQRVKTKNSFVLYDTPSLMAAKLETIQKEITVEVYGYHNDFAFVQVNGKWAWMLSS